MVRCHAEAGVVVAFLHTDQLLYQVDPTEGEEVVVLRLLLWVLCPDLCLLRQSLCVRRCVNSILGGLFQSCHRSDNLALGAMKVRLEEAEELVGGSFPCRGLSGR